jgi:hypothetical protein
LQRSGLATDLSPWLDANTLARVGADKKRSGRTLRFIALEGIGLPRLVEIELKDLPALLRG